MKRKAFSMIELLFVIVILAALTAIAIPNMKGGEDAALLTSMKSDILSINDSIVSYYTINGNIRNLNFSFLEDLDNNGFADIPSGSETSINKLLLPISKGNSISIEPSYTMSGSTKTFNDLSFYLIVDNLKTNKIVVLYQEKGPTIKVFNNYDEVNNYLWN